MSSRFPAPLARATLLSAALLALAACNSTQLTDPSTGAPLFAKGSSGGGGNGGGGNVPTPPPAAAPMTGTWTGENRWGPAIGDARQWTLTLTQSGAAFTGRLVTTTTTTAGVFEGEGNITVNGTLTGTDVTFTMRPKRGGSASTFVGTLAADGRSMRGVNWVPTVPASVLGGPFTLTKQ